MAADFPQGVHLSDVKVVLMETLDQLEKEEFERFKWRLKNTRHNIPPHQLTDADRARTVDLMVSFARADAVNGTLALLPEIPRNDLLEPLRNRARDAGVMGSPR
ncbi:uncharacterized protein LOC115423663 isoform X2 [Sphaeramia orbicularis]|uniref:uncharacterized protein LOC115423663 isoform X2 n=1 Tax=Sphaeramia orbicularis TaxID=375764 RepID=UPI00117FCE81|nr:uncharacterized protein LOC115423663 isoform X2 [Sphaeramia orbicularis]